MSSILTGPLMDMNFGEGKKQYSILEGLRGLADSRRFRTWLLDQYGVLHDGQRPYPGAIETLNNLAISGAKLVVLSNSSKRSASTIQRMENLGFSPSLFAGVITSGEITHQYLLRRQDPWFAGLGHRCIHMTWSLRGSISLEGLGLEVVEEVESAEFVLAHGTEALGRADGSVKPVGLEELEEIMEEMAIRGLPMIVANPDHVTVEERTLHVMPGTLGMKYEKLGGQVRYMGKPDSVIYQAAAELTSTKATEMVAVGDSLLHDIHGATMQDIESIFVAGGIHAAELGLNHVGQQPTIQALESLFKHYNIYPSNVVPLFAL